jgi:GDP-D-mannose dehydratase
MRKFSKINENFEILSNIDDMTFNINIKCDKDLAKEIVEMAINKLGEDKVNEIGIETIIQKSVQDYFDLLVNNTDWNLKDQVTGSEWYNRLDETIEDLFID